MRIGIDAYPLAKSLTGIGTYLTNIIKEIELIDKEHEYFLYTPRMLALPFKNKRWQVKLVRPLLPVKISTLWLIGMANFMALHDKIDIFWGTQNFLPLLFPGKVKRVLSLYDLVSLVCPQTLPKILYPAHKLLLKASVKSADEIFAISHATKDDIIKYFPDINERKIHVIYCGGPGKVFTPEDKEKSRHYLNKKFNVSAKFILTVTSFEWRKNVSGLLEAFSICKKKMNLEHKLVVIVGQRRSGVRGINKVYKKLKLENEVIFLDYVDIVDLAHFYRGADVFVFPSFYEGFGLPPLEAMACGTPVIASSIPVFKEILGNAALLADPYNPEDIALKIYEVISNVDLRNSLIHRGFEKIKIYSWKDAAKKILAILEGINCQKYG